MTQSSDEYITELADELMTVPKPLDLVARAPIGGVVRILRLSAHVRSQADLAERCGLSESFVKELEEGGIERDIDHESIQNLAGAFGLAASVLVFMFELAEAIQEGRGG